MVPIIIGALLVLAMAGVVLATSRSRWPAPRPLPKNWNRTDLGKVFPGVTPGMSKKQVRNALGKPDKVRLYPSPSGGVWEMWFYQSRELSVAACFDSSDNLERLEPYRREGASAASADPL